ncbi:MAG: DUF86 domain-containing protein [Candidatus Delongbacteria bacterium]|jgi:uncharacterized protein with HEPN domain|nr:DUF86 domain-containing protein [Candidatus Delongbacteria bacterium]
MFQDDNTRLKHMIEACEEAELFLGTMTFEELNADRKTLQAITRDIEIIGEAASKISVELKEKHSSIPWGSIIGMRNWLIHGYFNIDSEHIWGTVKNDIPELVSKLKEIG